MRVSTPIGTGATLSFQRVGTTALWVETAPVTGEGYAAYWMAAPPATVPDPLTPKDVWDDPTLRGTFVFLLAAPADPAALATALQQTGVIPDPAQTSFAWVVYDDVQGITATSLLEVADSSGTAVIKTSADYAFSTFGFPVFAGTPLDVVRDASQQPQTFRISYPPIEGFPAPNDRVSYLPLYGRGRFCLKNDTALISDFSDDTTSGSDTSFRYTALYDQKQLVTFRYPFLDTPAGYHLVFHVQWDPLGAKPPARTQLLFANEAYILITTGGPNPQSQILPVTGGDVLPTFFRTAYDEAVGLRALTENETNDPGRLVLDTWDDGGTIRYYFTPAGEFELAVPPTAPPSQRIAEGEETRRKLMCGLSGIETFDVRFRVSSTQRGDICLFTPYQAAYAPAFPLSGSSKSALLDSTYTTSWMSVYPLAEVTEDAPYYQSQADSAPLFHQQTASSDVLAFCDSATLILASASVSKAAPVVPYRGVAPEPLPLDSYSSFESQVLSPSRIAAITAVPPAERATRTTRVNVTDATTTTTPQGFLADIQGTAWNRVLLARSVTSKGEETMLQFSSLGADLRDALQTNELFLVVTLPEPLGTFQNTIAIADWPFTVNVGGRDSTGGYTNVLIFKFGQGTVAERAADTSLWTNATAFNADPTGVSFWLQAYFSETEQLARDDSRYQPFLELIGNANWNGVLALRVDIELQAFPDDIKGLLGGIDFSRFFGHHIGVNVNVVKTDGGIDMSNRSSLFGLINYIAKNDASAPTALAVRSRMAIEEATAAAGIYSFRVLTLQVVFTNSEIADFNSKIILTITRWFGDAVELEGYKDDPILRNSILLYGSYENHNGVPFYTFQGTGRFRFVATSVVLGYVEIVKAQFHTMKDTEEVTGSEDAELVRSRFSLWGYVSFLAVPNLDTLSFGNESDDTSGATRGLYCADIGVAMEFLLEQDVQPNPDFAFDAARMGFDLSLSYAREASLFRKFPFRVTKIESSDGDRKPTDAGYIPVTVPNLKTVPLQSEWYGLYMALNLGSMGALAENAGFSSGILAAWSPSASRASASVLMLIPGTGSGKTTLSLQNVLKLAINKIALVEEPSGSGYYLLKLNNIALSFFGKKLPTTGSTNLTLFSGDDVTSDSNLAWYGAYYDPSPAQVVPPRAQRALPPASKKVVR